MKVLLTGGTGFVGDHAAAAIAADGHDLRLLVRRPHQVEATLAPFALKIADVVVADATDPPRRRDSRDRRLRRRSARRELGIEPRPLHDTIRDTVGWLVGSGRAPARFAPSPSAAGTH